MTDSPDYFWRRIPHWVTLLGAGSAVAVSLLGALVGGMSLIAQQMSDPDGLSERYSVSMHVVAMVAVGGLSVAVATILSRQGLPLFGGLVLTAAVVGPMTVVAVPVTDSMVDTSTWQDTTVGWHVVVATVVAIVLAGWTVWSTRCLKERGAESVGATNRDRLAAATLFAVMVVAGVLAYSQIPVQSNEPAMRAVFGWALIAAGMAVASALARTAWVSLALFVGAAATLGLIFLAYTRLGGWPGVAGWEYNGMESPIITSIASTVVMLVAPLIGATAWLVRRVVRPGQAPGQGHGAEALAI